MARELLVTGSSGAGAGEPSPEGLEAVLERFHGHLTPLLGDGGFRSILELAQLRAMTHHTILEDLLVGAVGEPLLQRSPLAREGLSQEGMADAVVAVLGEVLVLLRGVGRDQDWAVADLWPSLEALKSAGLPIRPRAGSTIKSSS